MLLIAGDGTVFDNDLQFLHEVGALLDGRLEYLEHEATRVVDPDAFGIYDSAEHIIGLGFVACQTYLNAVSGSLRITKQRALETGPRHRSGYTIAELVNHAANFWKHHEEWPLTTNSSAQARTLAALSALDVKGSDYPLTLVLRALVLPTHGQFRALLSHLEAWRDALASIS